MFRCEVCNCVVPAGTRTTKIVLQTRQKEYAPRGGSPDRGRFVRGRRFRGRPSTRQHDKGGQGWEIVREASACPACAAAHEG